MYTALRFMFDLGFPAFLFEGFLFLTLLWSRLSSGRVTKAELKYTQFEFLFESKSLKLKTWNVHAFAFSLSTGRRVKMSLTDY